MFAIIGVLIGISIFFFDQFKSGQYLGDLIALASGLSFAAVFFANKLPNASPIDATYLGNLLSIFILPFILFDQSFILNQNPTTWLLIILMGVFQLGFGYIFFSLGIKHTPATTSSIIATLEPILNPIWVFLFLKEVPSTLALIGGLIVLITVSVYNTIVTRENYKQTL
jgi:drug/metabolite transporter (DMT)-like permease